MQQVAGVHKCFDGSLNRYLDQCLDTLSPTFMILLLEHVARETLRQMIWLNKHLVIMLKKRSILHLEKNGASIQEFGQISDGRSTDASANLDVEDRWSDQHGIAGLTRDLT